MTEVSKAKCAKQTFSILICKKKRHAFSAVKIETSTPTGTTCIWCLMLNAETEWQKTKLWQNWCCIWSTQRHSFATPFCFLCGVEQLSLSIISSWHQMVWMWTQSNGLDSADVIELACSRSLAFWFSLLWMHSCSFLVTGTHFAWFISDCSRIPAHNRINEQRGHDTTRAFQFPQ